MSAAFCHPRRLISVLSLLAVCGGLPSARGQTSSSTPALRDHLALPVKAGRGGGRGELDTVWSLAFARDNRTLAAGLVDRTVRLWDVTTGKEVAVLRGHTDGVRSVAFAPDGRILASGSRDGTVRLWSWGGPDQGKLLATLEGHKDQVLAVAFSPDGKLLASGSKDGSVRLWDVAARKTKASLELGNVPGWRPEVPRRASSVAFSPNGKLLAAVTTDVGRVWDVKTGRPLATLAVPRTFRVGSGGSPSLGSFGGGDRKELTDWSTLAFLPGGRRLLTTWWPDACSDRAPVKLWDTATGRAGNLLRVRVVAFKLPGGPVAPIDTRGSDVATTFAVSPNGRLVATCGLETPYTGKEKTADERGKAEQRMRSNLVKLWDGTSGRVLARMEGHTARLYAAAFSPDGSLLATGGSAKDGTIRVWVVANALRRARAPKRAP